MIKPEEKRPDEKTEVALPAAYMERVNAHAKELNDSSPGYVIRAIVVDYFDSGRDKESAGSANLKATRSARRKSEAKEQTVTIRQQRGKAVA